MLTASAILILVGQIIAIVASFIAIIQYVRNGNYIQEVHLSVNSRLDQILAITKTEAHAAGKDEGIAQQKSAQRTPP